jgi:adenine-specific DNA-methyltransferase
MPTLNWVGRDKVVNHHHEVPHRLLKKEYTSQANPGSPSNTTDNRIIHGDNLEVLKSLIPEFEGKVDCIYIDPPYNTGNEGWVYNDAVNDPKLKKWLGRVVGREDEDLTRHDKWLCMMYPRLKLLHRLLAETGVIFVSIDDNEQACMQLLLDEIFGKRNFVANFIWHHRKSSQNDTDVSLSHNYTICTAKHRRLFSLNRIAVENESGKFSNPDNDPRGAWVADPMDAPNIRENLTYPILNPNTDVAHFPPPGRCWRFTQEKFEKAAVENRIVFGKSGKGRPQYKRFLTEAMSKGTAPFTIWSDVDTATDATKQIMNIFGGIKNFDTPKPVGLLEKILQLATHPRSIILDSFAGSGTTAHAVLRLNARDGGNRRFVLCETMDYAETITAERVRRVINGFGSGNNTVKGTGGSFDFYTVGPHLFREDNNLNEAVGESALREYVAYTERVTEKQRLGVENLVSRYAIGVSATVLWLFYYEEDRITNLDLDFLAKINLKCLPNRPEHFVVYADKCSLDSGFLKKFGVEFKRIPRDITRF